jgi:hypothetical protein
MKFRFISDPGHGWLEVPVDLVDRAGVIGAVSKYSYHKGDLLYLEEDCDASRFLQALKKQGVNYEIEEVHQNPTPIRNYPRFRG